MERQELRTLEAAKLKEFSILAASLLLAGCDCDGPAPLPADQSDHVIISQGVWGHTWFREGVTSVNGGGCDTYPTVTAISAEVLIYPDVPNLEFLEFVTPYPGVGLLPRADFEEEFEVELIASTVSTEFGFFEIPLPPGRYALFVGFGDEILAPEGMPWPVVVIEGEVTFSDLRIREKPEE